VYEKYLSKYNLVKFSKAVSVLSRMIILIENCFCKKLYQAYPVLFFNSGITKFWKSVLTDLLCAGFLWIDPCEINTGNMLFIKIWKLRNIPSGQSLDITKVNHRSPYEKMYDGYSDNWPCFFIYEPGSETVYKWSQCKSETVYIMKLGEDESCEKNGNNPVRFIFAEYCDKIALKKSSGESILEETWHKVCEAEKKWRCGKIKLEFMVPRSDEMNSD